MFKIIFSLACVTCALHPNYLNRTFLSDNNQSFNMKNITQTNPKIFWEAVSEILMSEWNKTIAVKHGLKAEVLITITNNGFLTYKIKKLSPNRLFNAKVKVFLDDMREMSFPKYQWGLSSEVDVIFADQVIPYRMD